MMTLHLYRYTVGFFAGLALLLSCFQLTSCNSLRGKDVPDGLSAAVLSVDSPQYKFDWDRTTINYTPVSALVPKAKFWRLNVFQFSNGARVGDNDTTFYLLEGKDAKRSRVIYDLPWDRLLRVDLDLTNDLEADDKARTLSFIVLLHEAEKEETK